jgi:hypothetical protein
MTDEDLRSSTDWSIQNSNMTEWREDVRQPPSSEGNVEQLVVESVFGRTGVVTAQVGDYESAQVVIAPAISTARPWGDVRLYLTNLSGQVDTAQAAADAASSAASNALLKSGGTMTGPIVLAGDATASLNPASKQQLDGVNTTATAAQSAAATADSKAVAAQATANAAMPKAGGTFTGAVTLAADATAPLQPVSKQQLDAAVPSAADAMPKSGGTFTGPIVLSGDGTVPLNPASKQQLDAVVASQGNYLPKTGGTLTGSLTIDRALAGNSSLFLQNTGAVSAFAQIFRSAVSDAYLNIANTSPSGQPAAVALSPSPTSAAQDTLVQLFRTTTAAGKRALQWLKGDGSGVTVVAEAANNATFDGLDWTGKHAFAGAVTVAANPTVPLGVATKAYVDAAMSAEDNLLINGSMEVWQRGTSGFSSVGATLVKTADRWYAQAGTGGTIDVSQSVQAPAAGDVDRRFGLRVNRTVSGSTNTFIYQPIENVRTAAGQTVTLSFDVFSSVATSGLYLQCNQGFGSGGSPSAAVPTIGPTFSTVGQAWERKTLTMVLPSIVGKTIGTTGDDTLQIFLMLPAAAGNAIWHFSNIDLRLGPTAPVQFLRRPPQQELALCQRYYQLLKGVIISGVATAAATPAIPTIMFHSTMRAAPSATFANTVLGSANTPTVNGTTVDLARITVTSTITAGFFNAVTDLLLDAEL